MTPRLPIRSNFAAACLLAGLIPGLIALPLAAALALASPRDSALPAIVDSSRARIAEATAALGAPQPPAQLLPVEASIFPGTIVRDYRLRYAGGEQRWRLKFRRLSSGWALADLNVRSESSH